MQDVTNSVSQTCNGCGEAKPLEAFRSWAPGRYYGTCRACNSAKSSARRSAARAAPERLAEKARLAEERKAAREAQAAAQGRSRSIPATDTGPERQAALALQAAGRRAKAGLAERAAARREALSAAIRHLPPSEAKNAIWSRMFADRNWRAACGAVQQTPSGICSIALNGGGFISIAELAARVAEREEATRATKRLRRSPGEAVGRREIVSTQTDQAIGADLQDRDGERWAETFGDWAPGWMNAQGETWVYA